MIAPTRINQWMYLKSLLQEEEEKQNAVCPAKKLLNVDAQDENNL
jgi:hypothetical protein